MINAKIFKFVLEYIYEMVACHELSGIDYCVIVKLTKVHTEKPIHVGENYQNSSYKPNLKTKIVTIKKVKPRNV